MISYYTVTELLFSV